MLDRANRLLKALRATPNEGALVYVPSNMFYLSGYKGEGLLLISEAICAVVTDFRYTEQAEKEAPDFRIFMTDPDTSHEQIVGRICREYGINALYYEDDFVTVHQFSECQEKIPTVEWKTMDGAVEKLREIKDESELNCIREACKITGESFERILPGIKEGMTEREVALMLEFDMLSHGAGKLAFSTIVAAGAHGSLPHAVPGDYRIQRGDMITMDFGANFGNYCADMTRTVALGQPSDEMRKIYDIVLDAQKMTQDAVKPGLICREVDAIARDYIYSKGYEGRFGHGLGHAVGIDIHENPRFSQRCDALTEVGNVMTVEPGIYLPGVGGVRIENTVVVTENGCEALTLPTRELIIL